MQTRAAGNRLAPVLAIAVAGFVASPAAATAGALELVPEPGLLLALLVFFVLLIAPVNQLIFKPLFRVLDERRERIDGTRTRAQRLERQADEVLERYETAVRGEREAAEQERRTRLEQARGELLSTTGSARGEADREVERARTEIRASLQSARESLRGQSEELARQAASRVLGRAL
jgi:F-type H+-transporting ATPase subunit b